MFWLVKHAAKYASCAWIAAEQQCHTQTGAIRCRRVGAGHWAAHPVVDLAKLREPLVHVNNRLRAAASCDIMHVIQQGHATVDFDVMGHGVPCNATKHA